METWTIREANIIDPEKKYHFIYKTTNLVNKMYYLGAHETNDLNDGYLGSGIYIWKVIKKYRRNYNLISILPPFYPTI